MVTKKTLLSVLPPFEDKVRIASWGQSVDSITKQVIKEHERNETDYDLIYQYFDTGDIYETSKLLWDFCKANLIYNIESDDEQSVKTPAAILQNNAKVDCKHYSLFIGGVLDAIKANCGGDWDWCYRFVSDKSDGVIGHVFVIVVDENGKEIDIDPVLNSFNEKCIWTAITDSKPISVCISGADSPGNLPVLANYGKWIAFGVIGLGVYLGSKRNFKL